MVKVIITWAGSEKSESEFETREEAKQYIKDVLGPCPSNAHAEIVD